MMAQRPELNRIFEKYSSLKNKEWLSPAGLLHFIEVEQGIDYFTLDNCSDIISKYEPTNEGKSLGLMSIDGMSFFGGASFSSTPQQVAIDDHTLSSPLPPSQSQGLEHFCLAQNVISSKESTRQCVKT